jgi:hypothetical protein
MDALANMANQLQATGKHAPERPPENDSKAGRMRQALRDNGRQTARELAAVAGVRDSGRVGALLKYDIQAGRVHFSDGYYSWNFDHEPAARPAGPNSIREYLDWHEVANDDFPDPDITVIVRMVDNDEPVWLGYWDGEEWRDLDGQPVEVIRWADMPEGGSL